MKKKRYLIVMLIVLLFLIIWKMRYVGENQNELTSIEKNSNDIFYCYENHVENFKTTLLQSLNSIQNPTIVSDEFFYELRVPFESFQNSIRVRLTGLIKENEDIENIEDISFVCTIKNSNELVYWEAKPLVNNLSDSIWQKINIEFRIPASEINNKTLVVYIWNPNKFSNEYDLLEISVEEIDILSFMVDISKTIPYEVPQKIFFNEYYQIQYFTKSNSVLLADKNGVALTYPMVSILNYMQSDEIKQEINQKWEFLNTIKSNHKQEFQFQNNLKNGDKIFLNITGYIDNPEFTIEMSFSPQSPITVNRFALQFDIIDNFNRIMRKNNYEDTDNFQDEYHLAYGGIVAGEGHRSLAFNHLTSISSVQVNTQNKSICFNIDYEFDHPFIHFPLLPPDSTDYFIDLSAYKMNREDSLFGSFSMYIGTNTASLPRFMPVPFGYEAGVIFTEHADWTNIQTHRAVYFGHENIHCSNEATGGFVKYDIPVTKSVFYNNPDSVVNTVASKGLFNELHSTIKTNFDFFNFLKQLAEKGNDICLHTPEQYTSSQNQMREAMDFMQKHFGSSTWIDHGYNNSAESNRENLVCDGWIEQSSLYAIPLWQKHNVKYFWHPYFEDKPVYSNWSFDNNLLSPYPGFSDAFPFQPFATHPMLKDMVLWYTTSVLFMPDPGLWSYYFHPEQLNKLVENRGIYINHVYPAWVNTDKGFWSFDNEKNIVVNPEFDKVLNSISELKIEHKIYPTTIMQAIDYISAVRNINYSILPDCSINLKNNSNITIEGLSMIVSANKVSVNGSQPAYKNTGDEIIFWFDLKANDDARIVVY